MSTQQGTLELLALELTEVFKPLLTRLQKGNARMLFAQLGYVVSESQESALSSAINTVTLTTDELISLSLEIIEAAEQEDYGKLTQKVIEAGVKSGQLIDSFSDLQNALSGQGVSGDLSKFPERLFSYLLSEYFYQKEGFGPIFELLGIIEREDFNVASEDPENPPYTVSEFFFNRIFGWLADPGGEVQDQFDWGTAMFDGAKLLPRLAGMIGSTGLPAVYLADNDPPLLDMIFLEAFAKKDINPRGLFIGFASNITLENLTISDNDWKAEFSFAFSIPFNAGLVIQPGGKITLVPPDTSSDSISGEAEIKVTVARSTVPEPFVIIGQAGGSRVEFMKAGLALGTRLDWDSGTKKSAGEFSIEGSLTQGKIAIDASEGDGFLQNLISGVNVEAAFDIVMGYSSESGFYFEGSSSLEIKLPLHVSIGPINFEAITIGLRISPDELPVSLGADIRANVGPLTAVVENMGIMATFSFPDDRGNLGPLNASLDFKPPNGVGLSIDAGVVKGGGYLYFDFDKEEYAGALELVFSGFLTLKAIGLITTRMPDGSKGFSLLVIITAEFGSPIQLSFGFTLSGVGGLLGLHRTMRLEPLAEGVRTGAVNSVMFPTNVVENAPRIISDLRTFFPPQQDIFLIGPMAKIGWGTPNLVTLSLGIIIEIPGNIAILGVLKVALPDEDAALLILQVNFIGAIEFDKKRAWFFASMFESRVLYMTIEGEMGVLVAWGDNANFVVSVGGFHPAFNPPPLPFPEPKRIAISILNTSWAKIRVEGYFAVTSNTAQFGARAELYFGMSAFNIDGHIAFDALFQFSPFYFIIQISSSLSVKVFGAGLFSVRMRGELEGPTPWHVEGTGSISLLFFDIDVDFSHTWGEETETSLPPVEVMPLLKAEYEKLENWKADVPAANSLLVSLRKIETTEDLVLHPVGTLKISQRAAPLDLTIDKVGAQKPSDANYFTLSVATEGVDPEETKIEEKADIKEKFAIAQYKEMSDSKKLSAPAYEDMNGGIELSVKGEQLRTFGAVKRVIRYEQIIIDSNFKRFVRPFFKFFGVLFRLFLKGSAVTKSPLSNTYKKQKMPFEDKIHIMPNLYGVAFNTDNSPFNEEARAFTSYAQAEEFMQKKVHDNPNLQDSLHVIPEVEMKRAA